VIIVQCQMMNFSAIYHGDNKLHFDRMMMISTLH